MKQLLISISFIILNINIYAQDSLKSSSNETETFRKGFAIFPLPNKTMIGYRSNLHKKWTFETKLGYSIIAIPPPELNVEFNFLHRLVRNESFNFYNGLGITIDGFITPGINIPIGFEIKPFTKFRNIVFIVEASPKLTYNIAGTFYSTLNGNIGVIYFRPAKKSKS